MPVCDLMDCWSLCTSIGIVGDIKGAPGLIRVRGANRVLYNVSVRSVSDLTQQARQLLCWWNDDRLVPRPLLSPLPPCGHPYLAFNPDLWWT